jgi:fructan beta-fructosidase
MIKKYSRAGKIWMAMQFVACVATAQILPNTTIPMERPRLHFTPSINWMNDPNGMVYYQGQYHLFYQHYPDKPVWGPMHWGHATSTDLMHWQHQPIALYPDSLGYIFSGSAVVDVYNTAGFAKKGETALVAIFTHHLPDAPKDKIDFQYQSLAYSVDNGVTWTKYAGNPVLKNPGIIDFRDPKVIWYEPEQKWVMALATKDCITFYASTDLKNWATLSEFGKTAGAHGGVWECPDIFALEYNGRQVWVLLVSINPGAPNGGSATQYFLGDFDGKSFTAFDTVTRWMDYGPDNYAGVTWSNTGNRKILAGWMSNWNYANILPATNWRNALTIPRELSLQNAQGQLLLASAPVKELEAQYLKATTLKNITTATTLPAAAKQALLPCRIDMDLTTAAGFEIQLTNDAGEILSVGFDDSHQQFYIDRSKAGVHDFYKGFAVKSTVPRFKKGKLNFTLLLDINSAELFADDGCSVMTAVYFPVKKFTTINLLPAAGAAIQQVSITALKPAPVAVK